LAARQLQSKGWKTALSAILPATLPAVLPTEGLS